MIVVGVKEYEYEGVCNTCTYTWEFKHDSNYILFGTEEHIQVPHPICPYCRNQDIDLIITYDDDDTNSTPRFT